MVLRKTTDILTATEAVSVGSADPGVTSIGVWNADSSPRLDGDSHSKGVVSQWSRW